MQPMINFLFLFQRTLTVSPKSISESSKKLGIIAKLRHQCEDILYDNVLVAARSPSLLDTMNEMKESRET